MTPWGLRHGSIAAIVGDAPVLEYYSHTHREQRWMSSEASRAGQVWLRACAHEFLDQAADGQLLGAHQRGLVEELHAKYFGESP